MKIIKSHWRLVLVSALLLTAGFLVLRADARLSLMALFMEGPAYTPMNPVTRDAVITLLNDASLDRDALVALNPSSQQAESLLATARTWQASNAEALTTQYNAIHQKTHAVRVIEKAIAMGPFNENHATQLATAREELQTAQAAYRTTLANLESSISNALSESQRTTWTAIKSGWGQQMPIRMLSLSDEQRLAVSDAYHRYQRQHAAADSQEERSAAVSTWTAALETILTSNQETLMQSYNTNYANASEAVANAYTTVLPLVQVSEVTP